MYNKESEGCIMWNDNDLGIDWNVSNPIISLKDKKGLHFKDFKSKFDD
jgi:dTDP-4-dehydrorhamnose 3,5-epimerase